ncbi:MAG: DUF2062 domain-containing protein [Planctomycetota bacterium]
MSLKSLIKSRIIDPIVRAQGSPRSIARGAALGTWLTLTPTVGIQMSIAAAIGIPWGANLPIAIAIIWLSNPLTIIPLYYSYYWLGEQLLLRDARSYKELARQFIDVFRQIEAGGWSGFLDAMRVLGDGVLWPMVLGSLVIATACAIPAYYLALRWAARRQVRKLERQALASEALASGPTESTQ